MVLVMLTVQANRKKCLQKGRFLKVVVLLTVQANVIRSWSPPANETRQDMLETAKVLGDLGINGVKIHLLCVLNNTRLTKLYYQGKIPMMEEDEYVETACDFLELLPKEVTIHRLAGNGLKPNMLAPAWLSKKFVVLNKIDKLLEERGSYQGSKL